MASDIQFTNLANLSLIMSRMLNSAKNSLIPLTASGIFDMKFLSPSVKVFQKATKAFPLNFFMLSVNAAKKFLIESAAFPRPATITDETIIAKSPTF